MKKELSLVGGLGLGAGLMYLLDPDRGARRRAVIRDQFVHASHQARREFERTIHDLDNRTQGVLAKALSPVLSEPATDEVLVERVRARMGRVVSHPHAIHVAAADGAVTLTGAIMAGEVRRLLRAASTVRGVKSVENLLEPHETPGHIPGLQGEKRPVHRGDHWSPTARLFSCASGTALAIYGARRGGPIGVAIGATGLALATQGAMKSRIAPCCAREHPEEQAPVVEVASPGHEPPSCSAAVAAQA